MSIAVLAACVALTIGLMLMRLRHEAPTKEIVKEQTSGAPARVPEIATIAKAAGTTPRPVKRHLKPKANTNVAASRRQFLALPGYDPAVPADELHVVRVQLPGSALWQMGAPVSPDSGARQFMADFVVSQDGTPYAVRLVQ